MQNSKIFITGGSGFVGSYVLRNLKLEGFSCVALYRNEVPDLSGVEWMKGDLLNPSSYERHLENISTIVHAAGMVSYQHQDKEKLLYANLMATRELVNLALYNKVENFIFISSASTLLRSVNPTEIAVKAPGNPIFNSYYAKTKFLAELEVWRAAAEGMNVCILHPSLVIGKGNWNQGSMQVFKKVQSGISYYPPGNLGIVAASDVAQIVTQICKNGIVVQQILVNATSWSYKDFLNEIAICLSQRPIQKEASFWMAKLISIWDGLSTKWTGNDSIITRETIKNSFTKFRYMPTSVERDFHFKYQDIRKLIGEICSSQMADKQ